MRTLIVTIFIAVYSASITNGKLPLDPPEGCTIPDLVNTYRKTIYNLCVKGYKVVAGLSNVNFVMAPRSIWMTLAAITEGSDKETQKNLIKNLKLTEDSCIRQKFYEIATTRITSDNTGIVYNRTLLIDEGVTINSTWLDFVSKYSLLDVVKKPIKKDPVATADEVKRIMGPKLDLTGNSVILDVINYNGLWDTAFAEISKRSPFYSLAGEHIGFVDLMRVKRKVKMGYVKSINAKVLELPVGANNEYRIMFGLLLLDRNISGLVEKINSDILFEMVNSLKDSNVPVEIAIPKMKLSSDIDVRNVLEVLGIKNIWTSPDATKFISKPPATPSSYLQRVTWTFDKYGVAAAPTEQDPPPGTPTGLDPEVGTDFIADRPFLFGLFDAETYSPILGAGFSTPTYH